ncbi:hypothetical protein [Streptomyces sp. MK7]|uniref:hypothetical protein n=1 Tax=Streptomyces sp. MK7 TaxID=3067635 RepID=UPI002930BDCD|nr:hypothetical protein [Streptomyces sp. MK7]
MPMPYGTRGGMAFGAEELRVLRRALAVALHLRPARAEDLRDCLRLAESLDEAMREGARLRAFLLADLARYRDALPGAAAGYCALLEEALAVGYRPGPDDLAALGALRGSPAAAALLRRCRARSAAPDPAPTVPASRAPLRALRVVPEGLPRGLPGAGGAQGGETGKEPSRKPAPAPKPGERPAPARPEPAPAPGAPKPARRPVPTPGEVFPRRRPTPPSGDPQTPPQQRLAAV